MDTGLKGQVVVVTGGSRGIGAAIARALLGSGARVVLASRKQSDLDETAVELRKTGGEVLPLACHTGKAEEVQALFARVESEFGTVHGVVNNAATNPHFGPMLACPDGAFDKTFEVNVKGYLAVARAFAETVKKRGSGGSLVNVASIAGLSAAPMQGVYGMTKAAVISMTRTLAVELAALGIRVNAIAPGLVDTKFAAAIVGNPALREHVVKRTPLGRHGQPEEIAGAALYLLSPTSSFTTGSVMVIDGGLTAA